MSKRQGKLVVIEGGDGAGKGTQVKLLAAYCEHHQIPVAVFDFPQYKKTFFGDFCGRFLNGEFGDIRDVPPYIITIPYAADRWQAKEQMNRALSEGKLVLVNRYVPSNAVYQAAKLPKAKRQAFIDWEFQLEYQEFGIPKEDLVVYLHVPAKLSTMLVEKKDKRGYLDGDKKKDIHEANQKLVKEVEKLYLELCQQYPHWEVVECVENGVLLPPDVIHQRVVEEVKSMF